MVKGIFKCILGVLGLILLVPLIGRLLGEIKDFICGLDCAWLTPDILFGAGAVILIVIFLIIIFKN